MATMNTTLKGFGNMVYKGSLVAAGAVGSRYLTKRMGFKDRPIDFKLNSLAMLALEISAATYAVQKLEDSGAIPDKIFK